MWHGIHEAVHLIKKVRKNFVKVEGGQLHKSLENLGHDSEQFVRSS